MSQESKVQVSRRAFITRAGLGVGATGVAAIALSGERSAQASTGATGRPVAGYRETEHVRRAYALSRF